MYVYAPFVDEVTTTLGQLIGRGENFIIGLDSIGNLETEKLQDDITKLVDFLDEPSDLPSGMTVFARPCRADLIWGTTFNYREDLNPDGYSGWVPDGHGITSERRPPYEHPNVELILDLTREPDQLYDR